MNAPANTSRGPMDRCEEEVANMKLERRVQEQMPVPGELGSASVWQITPHRAKPRRQWPIRARDIRRATPKTMKARRLHRRLCVLKSLDGS